MALKSAFLTGILAHVPEAERGKAETELEALEKGTLRQEDYSKLANEATAAKQKFDDLYTKNTEWYESRQADLAELDTLRAAPKPTPAVPDPTKPVVPPSGFTKEEVLKLFDTTERGAVAFIAEANALTLKHFKEFGDILNVSDLLTDKRVQQIGLQGVYADRFKEQIAAKVKAADDARAETLRKEGYEKARAELANSRHPYPVVGNEPSALDGIEAARAGEKPAVKSVDDMASEYARLNATRAGAGSPAA